MSPTDRPAAVRRWVRRPLLWAAASLVLAAWLVHLDRRSAADRHAQFSDALRVSGVPTSDWEGGPELSVVYDHPSGQVVRAHSYVGDSDLLGAPGEPVDLEVSRSDPTDVRVVGDEDRPAHPEQYLLFAAPFVLAWAARRWSTGRSERLAASEVVAYQMRAVASSSGFWSGRWRAHLYALDAAPGSGPVCTAPLLSAPRDLGSRTVEVKGSPRPLGRVVIRDQGSGDVLWPSGRCLRSHGWGKRALEPGRRPHRNVVGRSLAVVGVALLVAGAMFDATTVDSIDRDERRYRVDAIVVSRAPTGDDPDSGAFDVSVEVEWLGARSVHRVHTTEEVGIGEAISVFIDPAEPDLVWAPGQEAPGGNTVGVFYVVGLLALVAAAIVRTRTQRDARGGSSHGRWAAWHRPRDGDGDDAQA